MKKVENFSYFISFHLIASNGVEKQERKQRPASYVQTPNSNFSEWVWKRDFYNTTWSHIFSSRLLTSPSPFSRSLFFTLLDVTVPCPGHCTDALSTLGSYHAISMDMCARSSLEIWIVVFSRCEMNKKNPKRLSPRDNFNEFFQIFWIHSL